MEIKTKNLDIVYCLKDKSNGEELKYSFRSLKNLEHNKVWLYGGCPEWVNHDTVIHIPVEQNLGNKWLNTSKLLKEIAQNDNITEDFIWFNDDFFVLKKMDSLRYYYDRTLGARATDFWKLGWQRMNSGYVHRLKIAERALKWNKCSSLNYELHIPFVFNRKKLLEIIEKYPSVGAKRSLYGNTFVKESIQANDVKIYNNESIPDKDWEFVSTSDGAFINGEVRRYLKKKFKEKSEYERD